MLTALDPLCARENSGRELDQAWKHVEDGHRPPLRSAARAEAFAVQLLGHLRQRDVLDYEFHHREKELHLRGIVFEPLAIAGHARSKRRFLEARRGFRTRFRNVALPLHCYQFPSGSLALAEIVQLQRPVERFPYTFWFCPDTSPFRASREP